MQTILAAVNQSVDARVSVHSIHELEASHVSHPDDALKLALTLPLLPYYPIGTISELLGTIDGLAGTFDDMRANHALQVRLESLAKAGTDLRDRGAVVDALRAKADAFVTSDGQLCKKGPASRVLSAFSLRVVTPQALAQELAP